MSEPRADQHPLPREELRTRIAEAVHTAMCGTDVEPNEKDLAAADVVMKLFTSVREEHDDIYLTTYGNARDQILRQYRIVAEVHSQRPVMQFEGDQVVP